MMWLHSRWLASRVVKGKHDEFNFISLRDSPKETDSEWTWRQAGLQAL